jgi:hypothetical protein
MFATRQIASLAQRSFSTSASSVRFYIRLFAWSFEFDYAKEAIARKKDLDSFE